MWCAQRVFGMCLRALGLYRRGVLNALDVRLTSLELSWPRLPAPFDGYRILQISDTHFDTLLELGEAACALLDGVEVDLIVLSGDFRGGLAGPFEEAFKPLWPILDVVKARDGCLAVLGNHDSADMIETLESRDIRVLINESIALERGGRASS
jgi:predicted MPP superfamily phosphohydrolase